MPDRSRVKLRSLPDGRFQDAWEEGWEGRILHLTLPEGHAGYSPGLLTEIETDSILYLGEVRQCGESGIQVLIEHSLDISRLAAIQDTWR